MQPGILLVTVAAALLQGSHASEVSIKMPYLSPAGVTYIDTVGPQALTYAYPAQVEARHVGYAAAQVPAVAAVPYIKHIPTVSHVPVTKIEAQPALVEKQLDVVKPALSTRKFEVRRPAIQKQFYDIEERVIVRPAGSAVVELDQPTSRIQKGPAFIHPLYPGAISQGISEIGGSYGFIPSTIAPPVGSSTPASNLNDENVVVENSELLRARDQLQAFKPDLRDFVRDRSNESFIAHDPSPGVIISPKSSPEQDKSNQDRLFELLTARGNVAEVAFGRSGLANTAIDEVNRVKGRVISVTPAPYNADAADERVSTRRVVFTKPIETLQELNVVEPATKIERVSVQQPTLIKTARVDHVQVHGSVPVVGKTLTPTLAHAAIPLYQKTISPAYEYYH